MKLHSLKITFKIVAVTLPIALFGGSARGQQQGERADYSAEYKTENQTAHKPVGPDDCARPGQLLFKPSRAVVGRAPVAADYMTVIAGNGSKLFLADCNPRVQGADSKNPTTWLVIRATIAIEGVSTFYSPSDRVWKTKLRSNEGDHYLNEDGSGVCMNHRLCNFAFRDDAGELGSESATDIFLQVWNREGSSVPLEIEVLGTLQWLMKEKLEQIY